MIISKVLGFLSLLVATYLCFGFIVIEPNNARVMIFFGNIRELLWNMVFLGESDLYKKKNNLSCQKLGCSTYQSER